MQSEDMKFSKKSLVIFVAISALYFITAFFLISRQEYAQSKEKMLATLQYVKTQYMEYKKMDTASEAKSLVRAVDKVHQVQMKLAQERKPLTPQLLHSYALEMRVTGVIVLDKDGKPVCESAEDNFTFRGLKDELLRSVILNLARQPRKVFIKRINLYDGSFLDLAAHERSDAPGIVVTYFHTPLNYIQNYNITMEMLLAGYSMDAVGTVVVSDGYRVLSSNDSELLRNPVRGNELLEQLQEKGHSGELLPLQTWSGAKYFGTLERGRDFYVYLYAPRSYVFASHWEKFAYAVVLYLVVLCLFQVFRRRSEQEHLAKQHELDEEYKKQLLEAARTAERANNAKTEFLQHMSHDIRTPINGVRGMLAIARQNKDNAAKLDECFAKIDEASGFLLDLVNDVLDMGKLDAGKVQLEQVPFDLRELCDDVVALVRRQAAEKDVEIVFQTDGVEHMQLIGSPLHVKRVLVNILTNAVKYNRPHGKIYLDRAEVENKDGIALLEFSCTDTGIGISKEFLPHIFEAFAQDIGAARSSYKGTGLGMAIVKSLVEKMGGTVSVTSELGVGSTFVVRLPFAVNIEAGEELAAQEAFDPQQVHGLHVLMAEDNSLNLEIAQFFLDNAGVTYHSVHDGAEAVLAFKKSAPGEYDAVLLDVMMPLMDGLEATRQIRALPREDAWTVPIIAMTANAFEDDKKRAFAAGMNEHLAKPLQSELLLRTLAKYAKNKKK